MKYTMFLIMGLLAACATANAADESHRGRGSGKLITPTLWAQAPVYFACNLTNVGDRVRTVRTRIINGANGQELLNKTTELAPRHTMDTTVAGPAAPGGPLYCEFTVPGAKNLYRGVAKLWGGPSAANASDITAIGAE